MMNSLVGYGSSSEEEDDSKPFEAAATKSSQSEIRNGRSVMTNGTDHDATDVSEPDFGTTSLESAQGPVVGPAMPIDLTSVASYAEEEEQNLPPISERDMLRHLTQPAYPMAAFPPEPNDTADAVVTTKFKRLLKLKAKGTHFNEDLANKTSFKNPNLFASLLERSKLESRAQYSSTVPSDVFSVDMFPEWAYKEVLAKHQQDISAEIEASKRGQSATGTRKIEFAPATHTQDTYDKVGKRKRT